MPKKREERDWSKVKEIGFQELKRMTPEIVDKLSSSGPNGSSRCFNMLGKRMDWVGFSYVDLEEEPQEHDIVVLDD